MKRSTLPAAAVAVLLAAACSTSPSETGSRQSLQEIVWAELARTITPGAVVAVVVGDTLAVLEGFGRADAFTDRPLGRNALFDAGGATSLVTALAAAHLAVRGEIDLDRPVGEYAPELPAELRGPTIAQLLTNTGGLVATPALAGRAGGETLAGAIGNLRRQDRLAEPGAVYSYSEAGPGLAAFAMERATGRPYPELVQETVFRPLGLTRATLTYPGADAITPGHGPSLTPSSPVRRVEPEPLSPLGVPARGLHATAADLANVVRAVITDGVVGGERRLPEGVVARALSPRVLRPDGEVATPGARIETWEGRRQLHVGSQTWCRADVYVALDVTFEVR